MMALDEYPLDLEQTWDEIEDEMRWRYEFTHAGETWSVFQTVWSTNTVYLWCNEGFGMAMHEHEWEMIRELADKWTDKNQVSDHD